jgi:4-amino-4-deoxy-L-arabinose transferase-like glycosyltransferase
MRPNEPEDRKEAFQPGRMPRAPAAADGRSDWRPILFLVALTLLAAALRFYRLGDWGFDSDEVFMQRDSINLRPTNPRPLMYLLNHYVVWPFHPLNELGLRLLPAIAGILAVPVFYFASRPIVGARAAMFGALLVATNSQLVYYSQFARYWTLVFLLSSVYPYALYLGIRDGKPWLLALGFVTGVLAVLAHPVAILALGGVGIWIVAVYLRHGRLGELWSNKKVRWGIAIVGILALVIAIRFVPVLQSWIAQHDRVPQGEKGGEFLLHTPSGRGVKQLSLLLAYLETLTVPMVLTGVLGIYLLWQGRSRPTAILLTSLFVFPIVFIGLVATRTAVSIFYLVPTTPALFMGAGVFLDRLAGADRKEHPRWLVPAAVLAMILVAGMPSLMSQYRDGRRWDFRGVAGWLEQRLTPRDIVVSDQPKVTAHYLPGRDVRRLLADPERLDRTMSELQGPPRAGTLWIVAPQPSHAFRTNPRLDDLNGWMYENCQLRRTIGVGRLDFRQNFLQVYRCRPEALNPRLPRP